MIKVSDFLDSLRLRRDSHVADFGSGVGENTKILSQLVTDGKVFAVDVQRDMLEHIDTDIKKEKRRMNNGGAGDYQNIKTIWGDIESLDGTRLRDDSIDAILITNTFYLLKHKKTCLMEMRRILKKYGKVLMVDWHKPIGQAIMHKEVVLNEKDIEAMCTEAGFAVYPILQKDDNHFVLLMEKR